MPTNPMSQFRKGAGGIPLLLPFFIMALVSCAPLPDIRSAAIGDLRPPQLAGIVATSARTIELTFDEPATIPADRMFLSPFVEATTGTLASQVVRIELAEDMKRGSRYLIEAVAQDERGNSLGFIVPVYGFNPDVPCLLINEFITNGTSTHPDIVELAILGDGNLAGVCLADGSPEDWNARIVLPDVDVVAGQFALVHCKPEGIPEEVDETADPSASGGLDSSTTAWDFWLPDGGGLSGNNGVLSLLRVPGGELLDAVIYSNRTSDSDDRYRGFGSTTMMNRVDEIVSLGGWAIELEQARPEDAVDPSDSTSTRSNCRSSGSEDTDGKADWHVVPTRGSTFGLPNRDDVYE